MALPYAGRTDPFRPENWHLNTKVKVKMSFHARTTEVLLCIGGQAIDVLVLLEFRCVARKFDDGFRLTDRLALDHFNQLVGVESAECLHRPRPNGRSRFGAWKRTENGQVFEWLDDFHPADFCDRTRSGFTNFLIFGLRTDSAQVQWSISEEFFPDGRIG